jgi:predicted alpha-1,2-mannosidase
MPAVGDVRLDAGTPGDGYVSRFSHKQEVAHPGYYKVFLQDPGVTAELTATERCGFHKYTFPATDNAHIVVDIDHGIQNGTRDSEVRVENSTTISGYRRSDGWGGDRIVYYVMQFSRPFDSYGLEKNGQRLPDGTADASDGKVKAFVSYKTKAGEAILVKVALSPTSVEAARRNLSAEIPGWDFNAVRMAAAKEWNRALGTVQAESPDPHVRRTFYTNLYLSYIAPTLYNDADGSYMGMDHKVHAAANFNNYTAFSLWDTYRAEQPLLAILQPQRENDIVNSLLAEYRENGQHTTPIWPLWGNETWCMIGYHSADVIADAYLKGFRGFDAEEAYQAIKDTAMQNRSGLSSYKTIGYVASRQGQQATSKTIEYSYDDWCIARMAQALGHDDDAKLFYKRAANYYNVFDRTSQFMRGRKADGSWRAAFDTRGMVGDEYTEADAWQYAFGIQQDVPGMIKLYGGDEGFVKKLDALFTMDSVVHTGIPDISGLIGQYSQGDEQCHHVAYLYDYAGQPSKTQYWTRQAMEREYQDTPAGECGNVDCGQMSAWYVFSAMGFYPVNPDSGVYAIGSPALSRIVLHLDTKQYGGRTFTMIAANNSAKNVYIQSATWNGKPYNKTYLTYKQITGGGVLRLVMGPKPNLSWGTSAESRPPSTMPAGFEYPALPDPFVQKIVSLSLPIRVACGSDDPVDDFVPDPNMLDGSTAQSDEHVDTSVPGAAPARVYQYERYASDFTYHFPVPKDKSYTVRLHFAEIFDNTPGERVENVAVNGKTVLPNFDIITAAGGMHKAVVKSFTGVKPDASGNIAVRISATPNSPDQNAKISAIEILPG